MSASTDSAAVTRVKSMTPVEAVSVLDAALADLGPRLTCREAEALATLMWNADQSVNITRLLSLHADGDDDPGDLHRSFTITRFYANEDVGTAVIATGLTLEEAQAHCQRDDTHGVDPERGPWFDGYEVE